jgi:hypothetical protein
VEDFFCFKTYSQPFTVAHAGGDASCDAIIALTQPTFQEFNWNLTQTTSECKQQIDDFGTTIGSLSPAEANSGIQAIYTSCSNDILGFLVETVSIVGELIGADPNKLLDIATGITNLPVPLPQQCVAYDLIFLFTQMVDVDTEFTAKIDALLPQN